MLANRSRAISELGMILNVVTRYFIANNVKFYCKITKNREKPTIV
jgi:hypothetical protein